MKVGDLVRHVHHGFVGIIVYAAPNGFYRCWTVLPVESNGWLRNCWEANMEMINESR